jgi:hypothetical protein
LVHAAEGDQDDKAVFMSCYAVMLFGVPNRGLNNSALMSMVRGQPNEELVRYLEPSSRFASDLHQRFYETFTLDHSKIICIYETKETPTVRVSSTSRSLFHMYAYVDFVRSGIKKLALGKEMVHQF